MEEVGSGVEWVLLALGILSAGWGGFELLTGGDAVYLLGTGGGCIAIWAALRADRLSDDDDPGTPAGGQAPQQPNEEPP